MTEKDLLKPEEADVSHMFDISGKTIVVTGAGGALCGGMSIALAELGARVALVDLDGAAAQKRTDEANDRAHASGNGGEASAFQCNVLDEAALVATREQIHAKYGTPDALVNGAGGNNPDGSTKGSFLEQANWGASGDGGIFDVSLDGFRKTFDLNFFGTFLPTKVFAAAMVRRGSGAIVNTSSMSAIRPLTKVGAYGSAKAAVSNFTAWLSVHLAHTGVRVNALAPGFFMTEQLRYLHVDQGTGNLTPRAEATINGTPMGRYGYADDLYGPLVFLISEASRFLTGVVLPVDGGFSVYSL
jgi:NAD(P)-dependent dehydrogenase (short-subunit alcohol dehydrogenase family)